ncbi:carnitine acetyl transferase protein [Pyrenophora tritici-repentis]|nr:carnitine acetyl transferase protein [Pyrenophora tritici-repentis]
MAVRTFTQPSSLEDTLVKASAMSGSENIAVRSEESAKNSTQSYSSEAQAPLASHTNPNSRPGITFAHQDSLPKLPIPELDSSCKKYLAALKPLQSPKEHSDTIHSVEDFLKSDGVILQEKLKKYANGKANYIEQFCKYPCSHDPYLKVSFISATHALTP